MSGMALIQVNPLTIVQEYGGGPPNPIIMPDGAHICAAVAGFEYAGFRIVNVVHAPESVPEFYSISGVVLSLSGDILTCTRTLSPADMSEVKSQLNSRIDNAAEKMRQQYITAGVGQSMVYMQKRNEAIALSADPTPDPAKYPLLNSTVGIEGNSITDVAALVLQISAQWSAIAAAIETTRMTAKTSISGAASVDNAVQIFNGVKWS